MSDESSATGTETGTIDRARPRTVTATLELMGLARADFDSAPGRDVMTAWGANGILVIVACDAQAHRIAAFLRSNGIAYPEHLPERQPIS